jgi:hypothetical protein
VQSDDVVTFHEDTPSSAARWRQQLRCDSHRNIATETFHELVPPNEKAKEILDGTNYRPTFVRHKSMWE